MLKLPLQILALSRQTQNRPTCLTGCSTCSPCNTFATKSANDFKVTVVGAAGNVGQPLSLLLKMNTQITTLALHDNVQVKGMAEDLSHISTSTNVEAFEGAYQLEQALDSASVVVMCAAKARTPNMEANYEVFANAPVAIDVARAVSIACPNAFLAVITDPLNMIVPIMARVLQEEDAYDPKRLFGVTTLDVVRAKTYFAQTINVDPLQVSVPVIGGHTPDTMLTIISRSFPVFDRGLCERETLLNRIHNAEHELAMAKMTVPQSEGTSTLAMAYAAAHFVRALLHALYGERSIIECAYVASDVTEAKFFASPVLLGRNGIKRYLEVPHLAEYEEKALGNLIKQLKREIKAAFKFPIR